jgi:hypothetical protein
MAAFVDFSLPSEMSGTVKIEYLCGFVKNKNKMPILRTGGPFVDFAAG